MPIRLNDTAIRAAYERLSRAGAEVSDRDLTSLLAAAADKSGTSATQAGTKLNAPGLSLAERAAIVKGGLTTSERADLVAILDAGALTLSPTAKALLEAVLGRDGFNPTPPSPPQPPPAPPVPVSTSALGDWFGAAPQTQDAGVGAKLETLASKARTTPGLSLDVAALMGVLGEVADTHGLSGEDAAGKLSTLSRSGQLALLRTGLTAEETADVRKLLTSTAPLTPASRLLLRDLVGEQRSLADTLALAEGTHATFTNGETLAFLTGGKVSLNGSAPLEIDANGKFEHKEGYLTTTGTITPEGRVMLEGSYGPRASFVPGTTVAREPALDQLIASRVGRTATALFDGSPGKLEVVSPELVRFTVEGRSTTARIEPDGRFVFAPLQPRGRPGAEPMWGTFTPSGNLEIRRGTHSSPTTQVFDPVPQPPTLDPQAEALMTVLRSRAGSSVRVSADVNVRLAPGGFAEITTPTDTWPVRIGLDGSFSLSIMGHGSAEVNGRFNPDGTVSISRAFAGSTMINSPRSFQLSGPEVAPLAFTPLERTLATVSSATAYDTGRVGSGLSVRVLSPNTLEVLESATLRKVSVDAEGFFSYPVSQYERRTGLVKPDGTVLFNNGSRAQLPAVRIGPFAPAWREEDLVAGASTSDPTRFVPMKPGSLAAAADEGVKEYLGQLAEPLVTGGLLAKNPFRLRWDASQLERQTALTALDTLLARRHQLQPAQAALVETFLRKRAEMQTAIRGLGNGAMPSAALTWLEQRTSYERGLPISATDAEGQTRLRELLTNGLGATASASTQTLQVNAQLLSSTQIKLSVRQFGHTNEFVANVGPDGAFGYTTPNGSVVTGHLTTKRGVVVQVRDPQGQNRERLSMKLNGGGTTPVTLPPSAPVAVPALASDLRPGLQPLLGARAIVPSSPALHVGLVRTDLLSVESSHGNFSLSVDRQGRVSGSVPAGTDWVKDPYNPNTSHPVNRPARQVTGTLAPDGTLTLAIGGTSTSGRLSTWP